MRRWRWPDAPPLALIVDDQEASLRLLGRALTDDDWDVMPATSGARALEQLSASSPDVMLVDWRMPVMDGLQLAHAVRAKGDDPDLPILLLVAEHERAFVADAFSAGVDDVLLKPIQTEELLARMLSHAELRRFRSRDS